MLSVVGEGLHISYIIGGVLTILAILILIAALIIYRSILWETKVFIILFFSVHDKLFNVNIHVIQYELTDTKSQSLPTRE